MKLISKKDLPKLLEKLKGKKIVTTNGSFDVFHYGHVLFLEEAKRQGDVLIVGLNSDESVRNWKRHIGYKDWDRRPLNSQEARAGVLAALSCVDYVVIFDEMDPIKLLDEIKPNVHVNGSEYGEDCIEAPTVRKNNGRIHIVKIQGNHSTSNLIKKILEAYK